jgi:hypothetical protein
MHAKKIEPSLVNRHAILALTQARPPAGQADQSSTSQFIEIASEPNFDPHVFASSENVTKIGGCRCWADVSGGGGWAQAHSENY